MNDLMLAASVSSTINPVVDVADRSSIKPVSLFEASFQVSDTCVGDDDVATRDVGAAGGAINVVAIVSLEEVELPPALTAFTL